MEIENIVLATPRVEAFFVEDLRLLSSTSVQLNHLLVRGLPLSAQQAGSWVFSGFSRDPWLKINYLCGFSGPHLGSQYYIISGLKDGLGPPDEDIPSGAKGVFPTKFQIRSGEWYPLKRIHLA